ncbi:MAG: hypothetical protein M1511_18110 [Deltaproteobacteria bacterium]|nr:hypothetical protein [Deltaproteobacteria bacterium]
MTRVKSELGPGVAVRLPVQLLLELEECAAKQERSVSQEIRYRLVQSFEGSESTKYPPENSEFLNNTKQNY